MPSMYIPALDDFGDMALPLQKLLHQHRHFQGRIRRLERDPWEALDRDGILRRHCSKRGRRHEYVVETREGLACVWCGIRRAEKVA